MKTAFSGAQAQWLALTDAQRANWDLYAIQTPYSGPLGNYFVPGRIIATAILSLRNFLNGVYAAGLPVANIAPGLGGWLNLTNVHEVPPGLPGTGIGVSFGTPSGLQSTMVYYEISPAFMPTRLRYKGPWNTGQSDHTAAIPPSTTGILSIVNLIEGMIYFVRIRAIFTTSPYKISREAIIRCTAVTIP